MIRKMLVIAVAVAVPTSVLAATTGPGVAAATKLAPTPGACAITGAVTFAVPGISGPGSITTKTVVSSTSVITPATGSLCGIKVIKSKIPTTTSPCWSVLPVYSKTAPVGGTLAPGAASACDVGGATAATDAVLNGTDIKKAIKSKYFYNSAGAFIAAGTTSIVAALTAKPIKLYNNGNASPLTLSGATSQLPGGACGAYAGFQITGTTTFVGAGHVVIDICLASDSGTATTGVFVTDLLGGTATIATGVIGGAASSITYSA